MAEMTREQKIERLKKLKRLEALKAQEVAEAPPKSLAAKAAEAVGSVVGPYLDAMQYPQKLASQALGDSATVDPGKVIDRRHESKFLMHNPLLANQLTSFKPF